MKSKLTVLIAILLVLGMAAGCAAPAAPAAAATTPASTPAPTPEVPEGDPIDESFMRFQDYGKVLSAVMEEDGVSITAEGYYGYHMDENPSMTVQVTISKDGVIQRVTNIANYKQSAGFADQITQEYLDAAYSSAIATPAMEADALSGATITCKAVLYAVQTAAYYAQNVYAYAADTNQADNEELSTVYPAAYTAINTGYTVDEKTLGTVLYAAEGKADDGTAVVALKIKTSKALNYAKSSNTGWDAAEPGPNTMIIVIDKSTNKVIAWKTLVDGTKRPEYFAVPEEIINRYMEVELSSESVFNDFTDGLVLELNVETELDGEGYNLITGSSVIYTGATESGTFSSQRVRQCFQAAAYFYCNYTK